MYIRKIELQGFKSFLNKTTINLERGVTTIVGPNGCGKTNIIDAVRWVLGEQKKSTLRSNKMEDVIFNGTSKLKPINFCQVKLTIENDRKKLPLEYAEVEICRKLFRSGESEYYINKNSCRLKDIYELFIDTGMGSDAYSVIELKMIENILSNDNSNFKKMLDEAAGISNYNQQRKNTNNKLNAVNRDLERVNDIIFEIDKNIKLLNLQMKRYKRHSKLNKDLMDNEIKLASLKLLKLTNQETPLITSFNSKNEDESEIIKKIEKANNKLNSKEKKQNDLLVKINDIKQKVDTNKDIMFNYNTDIIKLNEKQKYNNSQIEYYKDQLSQSDINDSHFQKKTTELKNKLKKILPLIDSHEKIYKKSKEELNKFKLNNQTQTALLNEANSNQYDYIKNISDSKSKVDFYNQNLDDLNKHLIDLEKFRYDKNCKFCIDNGKEQINETKSIKGKIKEAKTNLKNAKKIFESYTKKYNVKLKEIEKIKIEQQNLNETTEKLDEEFQNLKIKKIELDKEKEGLNFRITSILENHNELKSNVINFEKNIERLNKHNIDNDKNIILIKKKIEKLKKVLNDDINKLNDLDNKYNIINNDIKRVRSDILLIQQQKETKIADKQNIEIKINHIKNEKKIIENFINEKYNIDIMSSTISSDSNEVDNLNDKILQIKKSIENIGPINMAVENEYKTEKERFDFLSDQKNDLLESEHALLKTIKQLDLDAKLKFIDSFNLINKNLEKTFNMFFEGGKSHLKLMDESNPLESPVEIVAKPPGKKNKSLKMLSSGEKALSATAILFAIYLKKPSPFCILDEIDSPLDDNNIKKFTDVIKSFSKTTQFIIITHNKLTMQECDSMYGITQSTKGVSDVVSVKLSEVS
tara:strand:- start:1323 stop:3926 length:2604 start_codon:yes stop_codon:yes gene_type:complete